MLSGETDFQHRTASKAKLISRITIWITFGNVISHEYKWLIRTFSES